MCIAIATKPGKVIPDEVFERCWKQNADGFGLAYIGRDGNVVIDKSWMHLKGALHNYRKVAEDLKGADHHMLLHFRAATVGRVDASNCHPFKVKGGAMIHNGTFWRDSRATKSDSQMLAEMLHNELHVANLTTNHEQFQKAFGYNRVAFLFNGDKLVLFSEKYNGAQGQFGQWRDGIWYSNGGWAGGYGGNYGDGQPLPAALDQQAQQEAYDDWLYGRRGTNYRIG